MRRVLLACHFACAGLMFFAIGASPQDPFRVWMGGIVLTAQLVVLGAMVVVPRLGTLGAMRRLRRDLPWLLAEPVIVHEVAAEPGLAEACARHGFHTVGIDGKALHDWRALADALEQALGAMRFPAEPMAKCRELLLRAMGGDTRRTVLVVHDAVAMHPTLLAQFVDGFRAVAEQAPTGLRLLLDLPDAPVGPVPPRDVVLHRGDDAPPPDRRAVLGARGDGWWVPKAGELAADD